MTRGQVIRFTVTNPGSGYLTPPTVTITGGGPKAGGARAAAVLGGPDGHSIVNLNLLDPGHDYTEIPTVKIDGNATATAVISQVPVATLQGAITADQTTITVTSVPQFLPVEGSFPIRIGSETLRVTGGYTTNTWTVIRGVKDPATGEDTKPAAHAAGDEVTVLAARYDSLDPFDQGYRGYIGEQVGNQVNLGLQPHHQLTLKVPLVVWDGGRLSFIDAGPNGAQSPTDPFNPLNPDSTVWSFDKTALTYIVNADFADPASGPSSANANGKVMWYHAIVPIDFNTAAPVQLSEWSIRDAQQFKYAPDMGLDQLDPILNYDVSYVDNLTLPVVMEATNSNTSIPTNYTGPTIPPQPYGALGADVSVQQMQQSFAAFTATTPGQNNSLLGTYFGGKGYDKYYFPPGLNNLIKLPSGYNLIALDPSSLTTAPFDDTKFQLASGGDVGKVPQVTGTASGNQITGVDATLIAKLAPGMLIFGPPVEQGDYKKGTSILKAEGTTITLSTSALFTGSKAVSYDFVGSQYTSATGSTTGNPNDSFVTGIDPTKGVFLSKGMLVTGGGITSYALIFDTTYDSISKTYKVSLVDRNGNPYTPGKGSGPYVFTGAPSSYIETTLINNWYSWADYYVNNVKASEVSGNGSTHGTNNLNDANSLILDGLDESVVDQLEVGDVVSGPGIPKSDDPTKNITVAAIGVRIDPQNPTKLIPDKHSILLSNPVLTTETGKYSFFKPMAIARSNDAQPYTLTFPTTGQPNDPALDFARSVFDIMQAWSKLSESTYQTQSALLLRYVIGGNIGTFALQGKNIPTIRLNQIRDELKSVLRGVADYHQTPEFDPTGKEQWYPDPAVRTPGAKIKRADGTFADATFGVYNLNPYVWFDHIVLGMSGYGFSLDDDTANIQSNGTNLQVAFGNTQATSPGPVQSLAVKELYTPGAPFGTLNDTGYIDTTSGAARGFDLKKVTLVGGLSVATVGKLKAADTETLGALVTGFKIDTSGGKRPRVSLITVANPVNGQNTSYIVVDQPTPSDLLDPNYQFGNIPSQKDNKDGPKGPYRMSGFVHDVPVVTSFSPLQGKVGNGPIVITGQNFLNNVLGVTVNGQPVPKDGFTVNSDTMITVAKVPGGATTGRITVRGAPGTGYSTKDFTITGLTSPPPDPTVTFVETLYQDVLNRGPDAQGMAYWVALLQAGVTRQQVADGFWDSLEHRGLEVDQFYTTYLHRAAEPSGRAYWVNQLMAGMSEAQVANGFLTSNEYTQSHPSTVDYLFGLYADVLGRSPDANGLDAWLSAVQGGLSRAVVANGFLSSQEADLEHVNHDYANYLGRSGEAAGVAFWLGALESGQSSSQVAEAFLASDELFARAGG
jgi:hypothetical protein